MRILLIAPPLVKKIPPAVPPIVDESKGAYPPLGLLYLASQLLTMGKHEVRLLDCQMGYASSYAAVRETVCSFLPDLVGIQVMTPTLLDAVETARVVKECDGRIHVCFGGPHCAIYPEETILLKRDGVYVADSVVLGEGEHVFPELVECLSSSGDISHVVGVVSRSGGRAIPAAARGLIEDLDALPFPARQIAPSGEYCSALARRRPITTMMTSRGCPYKCIFCDRPHLGKRFRARSAKNVVDEMEECVRLGIREFFLYDDTFSIDRERTLKVADEIRARRLDILWDIRARVNTVDRQVLESLREAGCDRIHFGVEAGVQEILDNLKKGITLEEAEAAFRESKKAGITTLAYFMLGSPGETREHVKESMDFAIFLDPDYIHVAVTTPYPGTELYREGLARGILPYDYWKEFAKNPEDDFVPMVWEEKMSRAELLGLCSQFYQKFYFRPGKLVQSVLAVRSPSELWRKGLTGLNMLLKLR